MFTVENMSTQQLPMARVRLPPIQSDKSSSRFPIRQSPSQTTNGGRFDASAKPTYPTFPPLVHPPLNSPKQHSTRSTRRHDKKVKERITHIEKVPIHPPGSSYAILPPIGKKLGITGQSIKKQDGKIGQHKTQVAQKNPTIKISGAEKSPKRTSEVSIIPRNSPTKISGNSSMKNTSSSPRKAPTNSSMKKADYSPKKAAKSYSINDNIQQKSNKALTEAKNTKTTRGENRKSEYLFPVFESDMNINCIICPDHDSDSDDMEDDDDDDDKSMIGLSEALNEFLDWSPELREFLGSSVGKKRRNATSMSLDPALDNLLDKIREYLLRQTLEELGMAW